MHSFAKQAPLRKELLEGNTLKEYVRVANKLASDKKAIKVYHLGEYKHLLNNPDAWSPHYFGASIEFLCESFFEVFGAKYNVGNIRSTDDYHNAEDDGGVDHYAESLTHKALKGSQNYRRACPMSPVYIQTKGTTNRTKEFTTNDGSRIPNFMSNAQQQALQEGHPCTARYILFTTGKGMHYKLAKNHGEMVEVINFKEISKSVDGNIVFWNQMRKKAKVPLQVYSAPIDPQAKLNLVTNLAN